MVIAVADWIVLLAKVSYWSWLTVDDGLFFVKQDCKLGISNLLVNYQNKKKLMFCSFHLNGRFET